MDSYTHCWNCAEKFTPKNPYYAEQCCQDCYEVGDFIKDPDKNDHWDEVPDEEEEVAS